MEMQSHWIPLQTSPPSKVNLCILQEPGCSIKIRPAGRLYTKLRRRKILPIQHTFPVDFVNFELSTDRPVHNCFQQVTTWTTTEYYQRLSFNSLFQWRGRVSKPQSKSLSIKPKPITSWCLMLSSDTTAVILCFKILFIYNTSFLTHFFLSLN